MSWKDSLLPASFRGVEFKVGDIDTTVGRRTVDHEFPGRDEPYSEDLGRKAREYVINAYIIGTDYLAQRDALIDAIEKNDAPGTLVHPTLGTLEVVPKECRVIYNNQEGNLERFILKFVEAGKNEFPDSLDDTSYLSGFFADSGIDSFLSDFGLNFNVIDYPDFLFTSASTLTSSFITQITDAINFGVPNSGITDFLDSIGDFSSVFDTLLGSFASDLDDDDIEIEDTYPGRITTLISGLTDLYDSPTDAYKAQKSLLSFGEDLPTIPLTTPSRIQQNTNQTQLVNLVRHTALMEMVRATSQIDFVSRNDALATRDELNTLMETQIISVADSGNDTQYNALTKARTAMVKDITIRGAKLPDVVNVRTRDSIPALVFAYAQYEDASRDQEIIDRNNIRNPVFLPAQTDIEILA